MRFSAITGLILAQALLATTVADAQSLADVARREEARREAITAPSKLYTNESLRGDRAAPPPQTPSSAVPPEVAAGPEPQPSAPEAAPEEARDEQYWRGRIDAARLALTRAETFEEALQTRINALSADFVNRDDPAQRSVIAADRQKALAELDRVRQEIVAGRDAIAGIQEEARRAGVPPGWLR